MFEDIYIVVAPKGWLCSVFECALRCAALLKEDAYFYDSSQMIMGVSKKGGIVHSSAAARDGYWDLGPIKEHSC